MPTFDAGNIQATATLDRTPFQRSLEAAIREGKSFDGTTYTANLDLNYQQLDRKMTLAKAKLDQFAGTKYTAKLDADRSGVSRAVDAAQRELGRAGGKNINIKADLDSQPVMRKLAEIEAAANRTADSIGSGFTSQFQKLKFGAIFGGITLGAAVAGPTLIGLAGGLGVVATAALGVGSALKAYSASQKTADKTAAAGGATALSNSITIRNAQQAIQDARRQAGRAAEDSARSVAQAAAQEVRAAADVVKAQGEMAQARKDATRALEDAQQKVNDFTMTLEDAVVAEMRAAEEKQKVDQNSNSTMLDKREAMDRLIDAENRVQDINRQQKRDLEDLNSLQKKGVEGSDQVVSAKDRVAAAEQSLKDAQQATADAQRNAARSQEDSARSVSRAVQALADAQAQQGAAAEKASAKNDDFKQAMDKLSPAGQKVVRTLIDLKDGYDRISSESQGALFPGMTRALESLHQLEGPTVAGFKAIGKELSNTGDRASDLFKNPLFQSQWQQALENGAPVVGALGDAVVNLIGDFVKFGATARPVSDGVASAIGSLETGVDRFFSNFAPKSKEAGDTFTSFGVIVSDVLGGLGTFVGDFVTAWSNVRTSVEPAVRELIDVFGQLSGQGLGSFAASMGVVLTVVDGVLHAIEPFAGLLGGLTGDILAANLAFKIFAGPLGAVIKMFGAFRPSLMAANILGIVPAFAKAGVEIDKTTGKVVRNTDGLSKSSLAWGKVSGKVAEAGKYIPIIGLAIAGVSEIIDQTVPGLDDLAKGMLDGGDAAVKASDQFQAYRDGSLSFSNAMNALFGSSETDVVKKARELYDAMTPLQQATQNNTKAANDYQYALKHFGDQSIVTRDAANKYKQTTLDLKQAQYEAEQATKSHTEQIRDQQDAMLASEGSRIGYERSMLRVKDAQDALTTALKENKPESEAVKQAQLDYQQALLDSVTAAGSYADAQTALLSPAQQVAAHTQAINDQLVILATQTGTALPPELQKMINKMSDADLATYGVSVKVDKLGNKVLGLPPGKTLTFATDADRAAQSVNNLAGAVSNVAGSYKHWMDNYINLITTMNNNPVPSGAVDSPAGFGFIGHRAGGGPFVPGQPTVVGEQGPELVFPDRAAFVATAQQSKAILSGVAVGANGAARTDTAGLEARVASLEQMWAAGLRVTFDSGSLETGLIRADRRRVTR